MSTIWNRNSTPDILRSLETELAKAQNEIKCASGDVAKAQNRVAFVLSAIHELKKRDIQE